LKKAVKQKDGKTEDKVSQEPRNPGSLFTNQLVDLCDFNEFGKGNLKISWVLGFLRNFFKDRLRKLSLKESFNDSNFVNQT